MKPSIDCQFALPERTVVLDDAATGLRGFIVIHSTALGPAAGGCRFWSYVDDASACADAARLAQGMALKNALCDLPLGGGKAVLMAPSQPFDREALMKSFGAAVQRLAGEYITAEDVGTSPEDMLAISGETRFVAGLPRAGKAPGGDPSPWTALGLFEAMKVAVGHHLGRELRETTVAIQGLGHVGFALARLLHGAGARLLVTDVRSDAVATAAVRFGAQAWSTSSEAIAACEADVFAPCALGSVLTDEVALALKAKVVCGAANNQLASEEVARTLAGRGILYAPDFLVNAGGIINVAGEYLGWASDEVENRVAAIGPRLQRVLEEAEASGMTPLAAAEAKARAAIASAAAPPVRSAA